MQFDLLNRNNIYFKIIRYRSKEGQIIRKGVSTKLLFNSKFEDWIDASNQMLVLTWDADVNLASVDLVHDIPVTDLQVWDVNSDTLIKVIPGGIWGRISPERREDVFRHHYLCLPPDLPEHPGLGRGPDRYRQA